GIDTWISIQQRANTAQETLSFNTLCSDGSRLLTGGDFYYYPMMGTTMINCGEVLPTGVLAGQTFGVDSAINIMIQFKDQLIAGGKFNSGTKGWGSVTVNSIAAVQTAVNVKTLNKAETIFKIYPNPAPTNSVVAMQNNFDAKYLKLYDVTGKQMASTSVRADGKVQLPDLAAGLYIAELHNNKGEKTVSKLMVE
ncbi:MAG TPA: T9SS type A sorting domain-containing protein, partial [Flavipsychrobacter sp.]|nr:T9SS type A sorting domain-containing protein [Flavipsychrobacter sp.]